ncbi:MAG: hypothetical protein H6835_07700 [Planctomycetes bacterium]|nr:hypothetical protein [Planctomycetota bacterium]
MSAIPRPAPFLPLLLLAACASDAGTEAVIHDPDPLPDSAIAMNTVDPFVDLDLPPLDRDATTAFATATFALG